MGNAYLGAFCAFPIFFITYKILGQTLTNPGDSNDAVY